MPQGLKNAVKCVIFNWSSIDILYSFEWCGFNVQCAYILNGLLLHRTSVILLKVICVKVVFILCLIPVISFVNMYMFFLLPLIWYSHSRDFVHFLTCM